MLTKERIKELVVELTQANVVALIRADAGKPFNGMAAIGRLRELGLLEKASWSCTEDGRQVVGFLVGVRYTPKPERVADEPHRTPTASRSSKPNGKFKPQVGVPFAPMDSQRASICAQCREEVPKGALVIWIAAEGLFHTDCVETS